MTQTREKWGSLVLSRTDFCVVGRYHGILCFQFLFFLFRSNGKNEHLDENNFRHVHGNYFKSAVLKVTWLQLCFLKITRHIGNGIWKILYSWRFYGNGSIYTSIFSWVNIMKWKWVKVPWNLSVAQKSEPVLWRTLHPDISRIIVLCFAS